MSLTQPSTPLINLDYSPCIQNNVNSDSSYLDQKIKVRQECYSIWLPMMLHIFISPEDGMGLYWSDSLPPLPQ